jgi:F-type H+-transporting ATPase subunit delta
MTSKIIAKRYARALINLAHPNEEKVRQEMTMLLQMFQPGSEMHRLLEHPLIPENEKKQTMVNILQGKVEPLVIHFLDILISAKRINLMSDIVEIYNMLADEALGIVRAIVKSPFPISESKKEIIRQKLMVITKQTVFLDIKINSALLGGLTIQIGDRVMDGSVQGRLRDLKEKLLEIA